MYSFFDSSSSSSSSSSDVSLSCGGFEHSFTPPSDSSTAEALAGESAKSAGGGTQMESNRSSLGVVEADAMELGEAEATAERFGGVTAFAVSLDRPLLLLPLLTSLLLLLRLL